MSSHENGKPVVIDNIYGALLDQTYLLEFIIKEGYQLIL